MKVDEAAAEPIGENAEVDPREDGRTRCAWVRGHPDHYFFHDAEWGRLPDTDGPCFERVLLTLLQRELPLVEVLDSRAEMHEALNSWDPASLAGASNEMLDGLRERGGLFDDATRLRRLRDAAKACVELAGEFKGLRGYFLIMPGMTAAEQLDDVVGRLPGFTKLEAADLIQMMGCVGGCLETDSHDRDCWIA